MPLLVSLTSQTRHFILPLIGRKLDGKSENLRHISIAIPVLPAFAKRFDLLEDGKVKHLRGWVSCTHSFLGNKIARFACGRNWHVLGSLTRLMLEQVRHPARHRRREPRTGK